MMFFSKLRHFIRWDIGKYRKSGDTDTYQPFEGRTEKVSTCKTAKVDHVYQHVIKTEDVLLLSLLEHYIIECTRILRNNYSGCFCVFFTKKQTKQKQQPHTQTNKPKTNVSTSMPICYDGHIQYVKRYVS